MSSRRVGPWLVLALVCVPAPASAHLVSTRFGELYNGFLHPLLSLEHVVPWLGLGLLGGLQAVRTARWGLLALPAGAALGVLAAGLLPAVAFVTYVNLLSFVVLGALVVWALELPAAGFIALGAALGLSHGYANGAGEVGGQPLLYGCGVALAAYVLITLVTALAHALGTRGPWGKTALRAVGSWIIAIGVMFGAFSLIQP